MENSNCFFIFRYLNSVGKSSSLSIHVLKKDQNAIIGYGNVLIDSIPQVSVVFKFIGYAKKFMLM